MSETYKFSVDALTSQERTDRFKNLVRETCGIERVDVNLEKRLARIVSPSLLDIASIKKLLAGHGFHLAEIPQSVSQPMPPIVSVSPEQPGELTVCVAGMTCRSCELTIERKWKKLDGVKKVAADASTGKIRLVCSRTPKLDELQSVLGDDKYRVMPGDTPAAMLNTQRPTFMQLVGLFGLVLFFGWIAEKAGLLQTNISIGQGIGLGSVFLIGLLAASSSCIAVSGGLLLSSAAKFRERYGGSTPLSRMRPVFMFVAGRLTTYAVLGGVIGLIGSALSPSPTVTGSITVLAALYMLVMGLDMLHIAPSWLKRLLPRMPKALAHRAMDQEKKDHTLAPFFLGGATFFLPCGFTQALQLYALTTGSVLTSASLLFFFALGTAPALLALGWASGSLKGKVGHYFFRFSGALVVVLGLWNIQNGLTIAGYPLSLPKFEVSAAAAEPTGSGSDVQDPNVQFDGTMQVIAMSVYGLAPYYKPSDTYTVKAGIPVRMEISGLGTGCRSVFQIPKLGVKTFLEGSPTVVEFTAEKPGSYTFSCSMGMFRGTLNVI